MLFRLRVRSVRQSITLSIFPAFSVFCLGENFKWNHGAASHPSQLRRFSFLRKW